MFKNQGMVGLRFRLHFLPDMLKLELLIFARWCRKILKVWWEVFMGFVGNLPGFAAVKNFENPLGIDKVIAMSLV